MSTNLERAIWNAMGAYVRVPGQSPEIVVLGPGQFNRLVLGPKPFSADVVPTVDEIAEMDWTGGAL